MDLHEALDYAAANSDPDPVRKAAMDKLASEVTILKQQLLEQHNRLVDAGLI